MEDQKISTGKYVELIYHALKATKDCVDKCKILKKIGTELEEQDVECLGE